MNMSKYDAKEYLTNLREELHFDDKDCDDVLLYLTDYFNDYSKYLGNDFLNDFIGGDELNDLIQSGQTVLYYGDEIAAVNPVHYYQVSIRYVNLIKITDINKNDFDHWLLAQINKL